MLSGIPTSNWLRLRLGIRALACVLLSLAAWSFTPRPLSDLEPGAPLRVLVLDASASVQRPQRSWLPWVRELLEREAELALERGEDLALISFASDVSLLYGPASAADFGPRLRGLGGEPLDPRLGAGARDASQLAQAMGLAASLALAPGTRPGSVLLVGSDGFTGSSPTSQLARLRRAGVGLEWHPAPAAHWHDLRLDELRLEPELEAGAPILALAYLEYRPGSSKLEAAYLELEIKNGPELQSRRQELALPAGGGSFVVPVDCGPAGAGRTEVAARVRLLPVPSDTIPENDFLVGSTRAKGSRVILVTTHAERLHLARAWLAPSGGSSMPGLQFVFCALSELAPMLAQADALIAYDVPLDHLPGLLLEDFVKQGGGLLLTSGWRFLEDWAFGQAAGPLQDLLPAGPEPREPGDRDVILLVDGSGSMRGEPFETVRSACLDLVRHSAPEDRVVLRFFTIDLHREHVIKQRLSGDAQAAERSAAVARRLLDLHVPEGSTHILESLEHFVEEPRQRAAETLLFVLTDGIELDLIRDLQSRTDALHAALLQERTQIIPIAIGAKHDLEFLQLLARPGQAVARPEGLEDLRELFRREVSGARWRAREDAELGLEWAPGVAGELAHDLRGLGAAALTPLQRVIKNRLKPWGQAIWLADQGEPVLSAGRVGLGRVALLASTPGEGWAPRWIGQAGFGQPQDFENLLRWLGRKPAGPGPAVRLHQVGHELELRGLDSSWPASFELALVDTIQGSGREHARLRFEPPSSATSAGFIQRRAARLGDELVALAQGAAALQLLHPDGRRQFLPLTIPRAQEFSHQEPLDPAWFAGPARQPVGLLAGREIGPSPAAPYLLALGLVALFLGFARPTS